MEPFFFFQSIRLELPSKMDFIRDDCPLLGVFGEPTVCDNITFQNHGKNSKIPFQVMVQVMVEIPSFSNQL